MWPCEVVWSIGWSTGYQGIAYMVLHSLPAGWGLPEEERASLRHITQGTNRELESLANCSEANEWFDCMLDVVSQKAKSKKPTVCKSL